MKWDIFCGNNPNCFLIFLSLLIFSLLTGRGIGKKILGNGNGNSARKPPEHPLNTPIPNLLLPCFSRGCRAKMFYLHPQTFKVIADRIVGEPGYVLGVPLQGAEASSDRKQFLSNAAILSFAKNTGIRLYFKDDLSAGTILSRTFTILILKYIINFPITTKLKKMFLFFFERS